MSEANVEIVRRRFEAYKRRDWKAAMLSFAEDAEWHPYLGQIGGGIRRGRAEIEEMLREIDLDLEVAIEAEGFEDLGDDVLARVHAAGQGKESGANVDARWCQLWSLRNGEVVKVAAYPDAAAAREAAGSDSP
jgi:ketosteroid isomerase-like protein